MPSELLELKFIANSRLWKPNRSWLTMNIVDMAMEVAYIESNETIFWIDSQHELNCWFFHLRYFDKARVESRKFFSYLKAMGSITSWVRMKKMLSDFSSIEADWNWFLPRRRINVRRKTRNAVHWTDNDWSFDRNFYITRWETFRHVKLFRKRWWLIFY